MSTDLGLTDRQRIFVKSMASGSTGKQAAIDAGYNAKNAASTASRLLRQPHIRAAVARRQRGEAPPDLSTRDPLKWLASLMNNPEARMTARVQAAIALLPYVHKRVGAQSDQGKKAIADAEAQKAGAKSKFKTSPPPGQLNVVPIKKPE